LSARALTPGFAPIEQYNGGTDERSDVYALGATLFALLTGILPPSATNMATGTPLPPPRQLNRLVPERYSKVIERAMRLQPRDRYQSIAEFYQALFDRRLTTQPVLPAGSAQPVPQAAPTGSKRRGAVAASLAWHPRAP
jgi:serine/threonine protein kinase